MRVLKNNPAILCDTSPSHRDSTPPKGANETRCRGTSEGAGEEGSASGGTSLPVGSRRGNYRPVSAYCRPAPPAWHLAAAENRAFGLVRCLVAELPHKIIPQLSGAISHILATDL